MAAGSGACASDADSGTAPACEVESAGGFDGHGVSVARRLDAGAGSDLADGHGPGERARDEQLYVSRDPAALEHERGAAAGERGGMEARRAGVSGPCGGGGGAGQRREPGGGAGGAGGQVAAQRDAGGFLEGVRGEVCENAGADLRAIQRAFDARHRGEHAGRRTARRTGRCGGMAGR